MLRAQGAHQRTVKAAQACSPHLGGIMRCNRRPQPRHLTCLAAGLLGVPIVGSAQIDQLGAPEAALRSPWHGAPNEPYACARTPGARSRRETEMQSERPCQQPHRPRRHRPAGLRPWPGGDHSDLGLAETRRLQPHSAPSHDLGSPARNRQLPTAEPSTPVPPHSLLPRLRADCWRRPTLRT